MQTKPASRASYKIPQYKLMLAALLLGAMASESAFAQHRHNRHHGHHGSRIGLYIGAPLFAYSLARPYYYSPYYNPPAYYPPVIVAPVAPPTYIEQPPVQLAPQSYQQPSYPQQSYQPADAAPQSSGNMWYYCSEARAYYPYVKQCPAGWQQVTPQPQG